MVLRRSANHGRRSVNGWRSRRRVEKCDSCGHIDIREKFEKALNVCPECGKHRRIAAEDYIELLTDPGTWRELYAGLRSVDPLILSTTLTASKSPGRRAERRTRSTPAPRGWMVCTSTLR